MKALTLWRPWAGLIAAGVKDVENRDWPPPASIVGQRIAIHSGKTVDVDGERWAERLCRLRGLRWPTLAERDRQGIVAVAIVGAPVIGSASPWFVGRYGWPMLDVVRLPEPVPCRGAQGLWTVPPDVEARVLAQVARAGGADVRD